MENQTQRNKEYVVAALAENFFAGVGAVAVSWVILRIQTGYAPDWVWEWSGMIGLLVFGSLCMIRFSWDEVDKVAVSLEMQRLQEENTELKATDAEQRAEIARLTKALRTKEFAEASKDAKHIVVPDRYHTLRQNVSQIVDRWVNDVSFSRDACTMSKGDWEEAMRFLRDAGVIVRGGSGGRQWVFVDGVKRRDVDRAINERFHRLESHANTNFVVA